MWHQLRAMRSPEREKVRRAQGADVVEQGRRTEKSSQQGGRGAEKRAWPEREGQSSMYTFMTSSVPLRGP